MKSSSVSLSILTATLFAIPAPAGADTKPQNSQAEQPDRLGERRGELIRRFDKNGDGRLDEDEKATAHAAMRREDEKRGAGKQGKDGARMKQMLKRFDKDGDGRLNEAERAEAQKARKQFEQNGGPAKMREQVLKRFDRNGDGKLDQAERSAAKEFSAGIQKKNEQNDDGRSDQTERGVTMTEREATGAGNPASGK